MIDARSIEDNAFHDFERAGWEHVAEYYADAFGALTTQTAEALLDVVGARRDVRLLDVACGPGFVSTAAILRAQTPEALERIRTTVRGSVERYARGSVFDVPMPAVLASATRVG